MSTWRATHPPRFDLADRTEPWLRPSAPHLELTSAGGWRRCDSSPSARHRLVFMRAYVCDAGSSPTSTVARRSMLRSYASRWCSTRASRVALQSSWLVCGGRCACWPAADRTGVPVSRMRALRLKQPRWLRGGVKCHREGFRLVEYLPVLQAVVELADQFVEQVEGGGGVAVAVFSPELVVLAGGFAMRGRGGGAGTLGRPRPVGNRSVNISSGNNSRRCAARNANTLPAFRR